jgi:hypothetical protein
MKASIKIPTHLSEITLDQYQRFLKVETKTKDPYSLQCKMIEIFCNVEHDDVLKIQISDADSITEILREMFAQQPDLVRFFKMNGVNYGFHPNLEELTLGEYIDLDTYIGNWDNMSLAMNVLYRPVKQRSANKYLIEEYNPLNKDSMAYMPLDAVISSIFFLFLLGKDLSLHVTKPSLKDHQKPHQSHQDSLKNGGGMAQSIHSLKEILQNLKISQN